MQISNGRRAIVWFAMALVLTLAPVAGGQSKRLYSAAEHGQPASLIEAGSKTTIPIQGASPLGLKCAAFATRWIARDGIVLQTASQLLEEVSVYEPTHAWQIDLNDPNSNLGIYLESLPKDSDLQESMNNFTANWMARNIKSGGRFSRDELLGAELEIAGKKRNGRIFEMEWPTEHWVFEVYSLKLGDRLFLVAGSHLKTEPEFRQHLERMGRTLRLLGADETAPKDPDLSVECGGHTFSVNFGSALQIFHDGSKRTIYVNDTPWSRYRDAIHEFEHPKDAKPAYEESGYACEYTLMADGWRVVIELPFERAPVIYDLGLSVIKWRDWIGEIEGSAPGKTELLKVTMGDRKLLGRRIPYLYEGGQWAIEIFHLDLGAGAALIAKDVMEADRKAVDSAHRRICETLRRIDGSGFGDG